MSMAVAPPVDEARLNELRALAAETRRLIVKTISEAQAGHLGGPLSASGLREVFGESAPNAPVLEKYGLTVAHVAQAARALLTRWEAR
jgi:transketolase